MCINGADKSSYIKSSYITSFHSTVQRRLTEIASSANPAHSANEDVGGDTRISSDEILEPEVEAASSLIELADIAGLVHLSRTYAQVSPSLLAPKSIFSSQDTRIRGEK